MNTRQQTALVRALSGVIDEFDSMSVTDCLEVLKITRDTLLQVHKAPIMRLVVDNTVVIEPVRHVITCKYAEMKWESHNI